MTSTLGLNRTNEPSLSIKYSPCSRDEGTDDDLEEISIIDDTTKNDGGMSLSNYSKTEDDVDDDASQCGEFDDTSVEKSTELNGPKQLPGISAPASPNDKTKLIEDRISLKTNISTPVNSNRVFDQKPRSRASASRQSIFELVRVRARKASREDQFNLTKKVKSNEALASRGVRKQRRKEIQNRFGKKSIRSSEKFENASSVPDRDGCNWTFVFDPSGRLSYWWSSVVSIAFIYNFWVIIYRFAFQEINSDNISVWFSLDYLADLLYVMDIAFHFRTGYLEDGVLQTDSVKLRIHYMNTTKFYIDCLCLLPLDFLYLSIGFYSILRCFRLVKVYRFWAFLDRTERHTNYPNVMRTLTLMHYLLALFHWNACLYYIVATRLERQSTTWDFPKDNGDVFRQYLHALYWSTLTLTTVGNLPRPRTNGDYLFIIFELIFGLLLFATVLGHISNIVSCVSAARKDFQAKLDAVKTYMSLRRVPLRLQDRVIKWFDYLWMCNKSTDEEKTLGLLPDKLKAEIAIHVHLDTLKRVEIFQATEAGFLCELVLRLNPVLFSPGDYICRKGEVGKEMYIVNRGRLHVVGDNGKTVLATLKPGSYFGEISILNMGTSGNRRTASVRSVGYSDLFRLSKKDLWDVLKEYPAARVKLETVAVMRLEKTKKKPIDTVDLKRSKSTPGLVESTGKVPMVAMCITRHHTLPTSLPTQSSSRDPEYDGEPNMEGGEQVVMQQDQLNPEDGSQQQPALRTVSSVTSFLTGSPTVRSPVVTEGQAPMFHFSPPITPGVQQTHFQMPNPNINPMCSTNLNVYTDFQPRDQPHDYMTRVPAQITSMHLPYHPYSHVQTNHPQQPQMAFLSPYCASGAYIPSTSPTSSVSRNASPNNSNISQSTAGSVRGPSPQSVNLQPSPVIQMGSPLSFYNDATHDTMLQEITRLRERLLTVESENASMANKLKQQQWEIENRLSELEMQMCTSDMGSTESTDDRMVMNPFETVNRESII